MLHLIKLGLSTAIEMFGGIVNLSRLFVIAFLGLIITTYQNCSDVAFETANPADEKFSLEDELDSDLPELVERDEPRHEDDISDDDEKKYEYEADHHLKKCFRRGRLIESWAQDLAGADLDLQNKKGLKGYKNIGVLKVNNFVGLSAFLKVNKISEIQNLRGILKAQANEVDRLNNIRGISCLEANDIDFVDNYKGIQLIVNPDAQKLGEMESHRNSKGVLYLENMVVKELLNFRGLVILRNSRIESTKNVNAVIRDVVTGRRDRVRVERR